MIDDNDIGSKINDNQNNQSSDSDKNPEIVLNNNDTNPQEPAESVNEEDLVQDNVEQKEVIQVDVNKVDESEKPSIDIPVEDSPTQNSTTRIDPFDLLEDDSPSPLSSGYMEQLDEQGRRYPAPDYVTTNTPSSEPQEIDFQDDFKWVTEEDDEDDFSDDDKYEDEDYEDEESDSLEGLNWGKALFVSFIGALIVILLGCLGGVLGMALFVDSSGGLAQKAPENFEVYTIDPATTSGDFVSDLEDISDIVENSMPSIVSITSQVPMSVYFGFTNETYVSPTSGSGIIYAQSDDYVYVVTNYHVIENATTIKVTWIDGTASAADVQGTSQENDIALLRIQKAGIAPSTFEKLKVAVIGDSDAIKIGDGAIAIGNALGYGQTVTNGIISALDRNVYFEDGTSMMMIQTNAAINPGNSGGALLNGKGELIGINSAKYTSVDIEGIGYAIPINTVKQTIDEIINAPQQDEEVGVTMGITVYTVTDELSQTLMMPTGVGIQFVEEGSVAEKYNILPGDIITKLDDTDITRREELQEYLANTKVGSTVRVTLYRPTNNEYSQITIDITF